MNSVAKRYTVIISERASEMLIQYVRFLAQVSTEAADKLRLTIIEAVTSLQEFPERGSWLINPLLPTNKYRKLLVERQVFAYLPDQG